MSPFEEPQELQLDRHVQTELAKHPGQVAAVTRTAIRSVGDSPKAVVMNPRRLDTEVVPMIVWIPSDDPSRAY